MLKPLEERCMHDSKVLFSDDIPFSIAALLTCIDQYAMHSLQCLYYTV